MARVESARDVCQQHGLEYFAVEIAGRTDEHPWGNLEKPSFVHTLEDAGERTPTLKNNRLLLDYLDSEKPDFLAIPGWGFNFARAALRWCQKNNCHAILMSESKYDDCKRGMLKEKIKKHLYLKKFSAAIVGGQKHRSYLEGMGFEPKKIFYGYDVVDNRYFDRARRTAGVPRPEQIPNRPFFLTASRFLPRKNIPMLIRSYAKCVTTESPASAYDLVLLGDGSATERQSINEEIKAHGMQSRVHQIGFVTYAEVLSWYKYASALVHPALSEQWGLVVNEAMAAGLPVAVSDRCGCIPELVEEGINGFTFEPAALPSIAEALDKLATADLKLLGENSYEIINNRFSPEEFGNGLIGAVNAAASPTALIRT